MRVQSFTRSLPCSGCQWRPQCLELLAVAPRTNKGKSLARLYENITNSSSTCETLSMCTCVTSKTYIKGMPVQSFTRSLLCLGCQ